MLARCIEHARQEGGGAAHLALGLQSLQAEHHRCAMLATARGELRHLGDGIVRAFDDDMTIDLGQREEIALRVDDDLLNMLRATLEQPAQQMRFSRARICLLYTSRCV